MSICHLCYNKQKRITLRLFIVSPIILGDYTSIKEDFKNNTKVNPAQLFLAFPKEHNHELTKELGQTTKTVLTKNIAFDLVKTDKEKILSHFA